MSAITGNKLTVWKLDDSLGIIPFACSRSCALQVNLGLKEVTNYASANWQEFKEDLLTWSVTNDGLIMNSNYSYVLLMRDQKLRRKYYFQFIVDNGVDGFYIVSGYCFITNITINGPQKDVASISCTLQGTGSYTITDTPISPITGDMTNPAHFQASGGETSFVVTDLIACNKLLYASRGGIDIRGNIITVGTPTGEDIKIDTITGTITIDAANPCNPGEWWNFLYR
jgi:hypothetical protein